MRSRFSAAFVTAAAFISTLAVGVVITADAAAPDISPADTESAGGSTATPGISEGSVGRGASVPSGEARSIAAEHLPGYTRAGSRRVEAMLDVRLTVVEPNSSGSIPYGWFVWEDIPNLIELADSPEAAERIDRLRSRLLLHIQRSALSDKASAGAVRKGLIALWFTEGARRAVLSQQEKLGDGAMTPFPALTATGEGTDGKALSEEEEALAYDECLRAYREWWLSVADLPEREAAAKDPLEETRWHWSGTTAVR